MTRPRLGSKGNAPASLRRSARRGREQRRRAEQAGRLAELLCIWLLRLKGYRILAQDLRLGVGEIDIIARRGNTICIVEVKRRAAIETAAEAISARQRGRIARAAAAYLGRMPQFAHLSMRFDVMLVAPAGIPRHIKDAWRP